MKLHQVQGGYERLSVGSTRLLSITEGNDGLAHLPALWARFLYSPPGRWIRSHSSVVWRAIFAVVVAVAFLRVQSGLPYYPTPMVPLIVAGLLACAYFAPKAAPWVLYGLAAIPLADHWLPAAFLLAAVGFFIILATDEPWAETGVPILALLALAAPWLAEHGLPFLAPLLLGFMLPANVAFWAATGISVWQLCLAGTLSRPFIVPDVFPVRPWDGSLIHVATSSANVYSTQNWFMVQAPDLTKNLGALLAHFAHYWPELIFVLGIGAAAAITSTVVRREVFDRGPVAGVAAAVAGGQAAWLPAFLLLSRMPELRGFDVSGMIGAGVASAAVAFLIHWIGLGPRPTLQPVTPGAPTVHGPPPAIPASRRKTTSQNRWSPETWKWPRVAGYDQVKRELFDAARAALDPKLRTELARARVRVPRGILLYGPPGTGKTTLARDLAEQAGVTLRSFSGGEFFSKYVGESERQLRQVFAAARETAKEGQDGYILFFDEIEAFLRPRSADAESALHSSVVSTFLGEMDGFKGLAGVLVVGATNLPDQIDQAALRPGRFDRIIYVGPPDRKARVALWRFYLSGKRYAEEVDLDALAAMTERCTAADIENICTSAYLSAREQHRPIEQADLEALIKANKPSLTVAVLKRYEALRDKFNRTGKIVEREFAMERPEIGWEQIAGQTEAKRILQETVNLLVGNGKDLAAVYGLEPPKGVLLFGPPGCGKTLLGKAVASQMKAGFFVVNGPELVSKWLGETEGNLRDMFDRARENAPSVMFFDEMDALAGSRSDDNPHRHHAIEQLLTEMDGMDAAEGLLVMAATNRPDLLDAALLRPGRFDRVVYIGPPDASEREAAFRIHLAGKPGAEAVDYAVLAAATEGFSGADIRFACNQTLTTLFRAAALENHPLPVTTNDLMKTIEDMHPSLKPEELAYYEELRARLTR